jgi:hypothetical protein
MLRGCWAARNASRTPSSAEAGRPSGPASSSSSLSAAEQRRQISAPARTPKPMACSPQREQRPVGAQWQAWHRSGRPSRARTAIRLVRPQRPQRRGGVR